MKRFLLLVAILIATTAVNAQVVSKDTVSIKKSELTVISKENGTNKNGETKYLHYFRYSNKNITTDKQSVENFKNPQSKAYIVYNNYATGERKVSKVYVN